MPTRGHLAMSGLWLSRLGGGAAVTAGTEWVDTRDAV